MPEEASREHNEQSYVESRITYDQIEAQPDYPAVRRLLGWDREPFVPVHFGDDAERLVPSEPPEPVPLSRHYLAKDTDTAMPDIHDPHLLLNEFCAEVENAYHTEHIALFHARMTRFRVLANPLSTWERLWAEFIASDGDGMTAAPPARS